eukprot:7652473-Pyramimonas_sp.AAC.1
MEILSDHLGSLYSKRQPLLGFGRNAASASLADQGHDGETADQMPLCPFRDSLQRSSATQLDRLAPETG